MTSRRGLDVVRGLVAAAAVLLLFSCATAPKRSTTEWMGVLPGDATIYMSVSVPPSAALIRKTLKDSGPDFKDVITLADRTKRLLMAVTLARGAPAQFSVVALGEYPSFLIGLSLSGKKEWKQVSLPQGSYYLWNKASLQLSVPNGGLLMAANGGMPSLLSRYKTPVPLPIPAEVSSDMERTDVVVYMPQLPGGLGQDPEEQPVSEDSSGTPRLPIREVWIDAMKTQGGYQLGGTLNTPSEQKARVLALLVRVAIVAWLKGTDSADPAERLKTISVTPDGTLVRVKGVALSDAELLPLFYTLLNGSPPSMEQGK